MVWPSLLRRLLESRTAPSTSASSSAGTSPTLPVNLSADELASKTGLYRIGSDENHIVSMSVRDGKFTLRDFYGDNYDMAMTPISPSRFLIPGATLESRQPTPGGLSRGTSLTAQDSECWSFR